MANASWVFIEACWVVWLAIWIAMAFRTKRTVERSGIVPYRLVAAAVLLGAIAASHLVHVSTHSRLWETTAALGIATAALVAAGFAFCVWARVTLGRNWSGEVTFKEDHELIETGPYALVRHPIYTGLIAMALGTALNYGRAFGFVVFAAVCAALWWKARVEERVMSRHFPDTYPGYKARVHAIIPFVL
jgi:protein-S-isoprenylcysteine O-methyltransferase Ste14